MYVVIEYRPYDYDERLVRWFDTETGANVWCRERLRQHGPSYEVHRLMPDRTVECVRRHLPPATKETP